MANTDPHRLAPARTDLVRTFLWVVVVLSAAGNMAASFGGAHTWAHLACGVVTALGVGALVLRALRDRRGEPVG